MNLIYHLLAIAASSQYGSIIRIEQHLLIITNQYRFFWNILPKFTDYFIPKHKFMQKIKKYNFVQKTSKLENSFHSSKSPDKYIMLQVPQNFLKLIKSATSVRDKCMSERESLKMRVQKIKKLMQQQSAEGNKMLKNYQLLQAIYSLKEINRKVFIYQNQMTEIANSLKFSEFESSQNTQNMLDLDPQKTIFKRKAYPFYTYNHIRN